MTLEQRADLREVLRLGMAIQGPLLREVLDSLDALTQERDLHLNYHGKLQEAIIAAHVAILPQNWEYVDPATTINLMKAEITCTRTERDTLSAEVERLRGINAEGLERATAALLKDAEVVALKEALNNCRRILRYLLETGYLDHLTIEYVIWWTIPRHMVDTYSPTSDTSLRH